MKISRITSIGLLCLSFGAMFAPAARADEYDHKTVVTFSAPVEIPGRVLPAGKYVFKLVDSDSNRHIVQILNAREDKVFATLLAIPEERQKTPDKTIINFSERASGSPEAIQSWFYPGDNIGEEFVYPKDRAVQLAKHHKKPVKAMPVEMAENITKSEIPVTPKTPSTAPAEQPEHLAQLKQAPVQVAQPKGEEVEIVELQGTVNVLPDTASQLPVVASLGMMLLAASGGIRLVRGKLCKS